MKSLVESVKVAPSILSADFAVLGSELKACEEAGADYIHIDVMDGQFVPNITIGPLMVEACKRSVALPLDVHLMIVNPERYIQDFIAAGANIITIHAESTPHVHRTLQQIKEAGIKAGLAVNPLTPLDIYRDALPYLDLALVMTVNPGFGGQSFITHCLSKISTLQSWIQDINPTCELEIDGGVNTSTIYAAAEAGANVLVAGSAVFNTKGSVAQNLQLLKGALG